MVQISTEEAVERYGAAVYRMACAQTHSRHDADDIFQEVFLRFHHSAPKFQSEAHQKAWLLRVTVNCTRSFFSAPWRRRTVPLEDIYACAGPEESSVNEALSHLDTKYRAVVHLYYYEGYSTEEIAQILRRRPSTVRAQLTRARQKLSELLGPV